MTHALSHKGLVSKIQLQTKKTTPTENMAKILERAQFANIEKVSELIIRKMQIKAKIHQRVQNEKDSYQVCQGHRLTAGGVVGQGHTGTVPLEVSLIGQPKLNMLAP